jgi:phosphatidate phosphatase APP1
VRRDQRIFFPALGLPTGEGTWQIDLHAWCFRLRPRRLVIPLVRKALGFDHVTLTSSQKQTFAERARWMFVDNRRGRSIAVTAEGGTHGLGRTRANGHLRAHIEVNLPAERVPPECAVAPVSRHVRAPESIEIHFLAAEGLSVVSDLDDTIRVSRVADRAALLRGTFVEPFEAVPRMAELYRAWARYGAQFHYVSATPWQLYVPIATFINASGFPKGTFHLRDFRWHDRTFFNLFASPDLYKRNGIEPLLKRLPRRRFVLVGDSGQRDPEVFGDLARRYPRQVRWIFVRDLGVVARMSRYRAAFAGIDPRIWRVFTDPATLPTTLLDGLI